MKTLSNITFTVCTVFLLALGTAAEELAVGDFKITVDEPWKVLSDEVKKQTGYMAVWVNPKSMRPNAALLAANLPGSVSHEADGMVSSAKDQPDVIKLLEDRKVKLKDGGDARIVSIEIRAGNPQLAIDAPMIFHSIYLPTKDGKSVTFKLQCAKTNIDALKLTFESLVLEALIAKPKLEQEGADQPATTPK